MTNVINLSRAADGVDFVITEKDLTIQFTNPLDFDPDEDVLVTEAEGRIVGLARVWRKSRENGGCSYGHSVELLEEWRDKGVRECLFHHNEDHIRRMAKIDGKEEASVFELWTNDAENQWKSIVLDNGYRPVQHELDLIRGLDTIQEFPLPEGIQVRPVDPSHYEAIREANREAWKRDWNFSKEDWNEEYFRAFMKKSAFQPQLWQVAWKGDLLAGMVLNYIIDEENMQLGTKRGHTENVFVREQFRGIGLARALLSRSFRVLKDRGMEEAMLSAEIENPHGALRLYEGMGFKVVNHLTWYQKPLV